MKKSLVVTLSTLAAGITVCGIMRIKNHMESKKFLKDAKAFSEMWEAEDSTLQNILSKALTKETLTDTDIQFLTDLRNKLLHEKEYRTFLLDADAVAEAIKKVLNMQYGKETVQ